MTISWFFAKLNNYRDPLTTYYTTVLILSGAVWFLYPSLREKCPCLQFFWSTFSHIRTEYEEIRQDWIQQRTIEDCSIPLSMVLNLNQTPLKYVPVASQTLSQKGAKHISIYGVAFKKAITAKFGNTNKFLLMYLIYGVKIQRSYPNFAFSGLFSLSCNLKHFSNNQELLTLIEEIIIRYLEKEWEKLKLESNHWRLLIIDVFSGQMTDPVLAKLKENYIKLVRVPTNMTDFSTLDLTVNGST